MVTGSGRGVWAPGACQRYDIQSTPLLANNNFRYLLTFTSSTAGITVRWIGGPLESWYSRWSVDTRHSTRRTPWRYTSRLVEGIVCHQNAHQAQEWLQRRHEMRMIQRGVRFNRSRFYTDEAVDSITISDNITEILDANPTSLPRKLSRAISGNLEVWDFDLFCHYFRVDKHQILSFSGCWWVDRFPRPRLWRSHGSYQRIVAAQSNETARESFWWSIWHKIPPILRQSPLEISAIYESQSTLYS